jgi:hypothetical protein
MPYSGPRASSRKALFGNLCHWDLKIRFWLSMLLQQMGQAFCLVISCQQKLLPGFIPKGGFSQSQI